MIEPIKTNWIKTILVFIILILFASPMILHFLGIRISVFMQWIFFLMPLFPLILSPINRYRESHTNYHYQAPRKRKSDSGYLVISYGIAFFLWVPLMINNHHSSFESNLTPTLITLLFITLTLIPNIIKSKKKSIKGFLSFLVMGSILSYEFVDISNQLFDFSDPTRTLGNVIDLETNHVGRSTFYKVHIVFKADSKPQIIDVLRTEYNQIRIGDYAEFDVYKGFYNSKWFKFVGNGNESS